MKPDHFDVASAAARACAHKLVNEDIPPVVIADGLVTQALAVWAASTGRQQSAATVLKIWTAVRDAR
ncbi:hypothetical protein NOI24_08380 [Neorhizobium galegae]|uniref:hypothetical protein n=1 Tax=Neorhizobium galegae TaxID=399 RepID=UPI0021072280|nr:hypothetical protein [Neorhizobium galegae]MCQ1771313.1 hypothetical protein [Neorhizobium galegae]MCQ1799801.1 hypothetical protein [Neorhizobium galegae]